jgi:hypothetical protein
MLAISTELNPAVRSVTDWNQAFCILSIIDKPVKTPFHSNTSTKNVPVINKATEVIKAILAGIGMDFPTTHLGATKLVAGAIPPKTIRPATMCSTKGLVW